ncbi:MAG: VOC family protein, partial [Planctomycetota bacterium]
MTTQLDHLVITCSSLDRGVAWLEEQLGCVMSSGGTHAKMGTHNAIVKIGPRVYIEVIAVHPEMERPNRDRWFGLDLIGSDDLPQLASWVARTASLDGVISNGLWSADSISTMSRDSLDWKITIPSHDDWA